MTEKGTGYPGHVVIVGYEMPAMGNWIQVIVGEHDVLLTAKPPLSHLATAKPWVPFVGWNTVFPAMNKLHTREST